jgi:hypothetical protein
VAPRRRPPHGPRAGLAPQHLRRPPGRGAGAHAPQRGGDPRVGLRPAGPRHVRQHDPRLPERRLPAGREPRALPDLRGGGGRRRLAGPDRRRGGALDPRAGPERAATPPAGRGGDRLHAGGARSAREPFGTAAAAGVPMAVGPLLREAVAAFVVPLLWAPTGASRTQRRGRGSLSRWPRSSPCRASLGSSRRPWWSSRCRWAALRRIPVRPTVPSCCPCVTRSP